MVRAVRRDARRDLADARAHRSHRRRSPACAARSTCPCFCIRATCRTIARCRRARRRCTACLRAAGRAGRASSPRATCFACGDLRFDVMHVPGHAPGHVRFNGTASSFGGDLLFAGSIGRTDLPLGDPAEMDASLERYVCELADETVVYPGHGPRTTIGRERRDESVPDRRRAHRCADERRALDATLVAVIALLAAWLGAAIIVGAVVAPARVRRAADAHARRRARRSRAAGALLRDAASAVGRHRGRWRRARGAAHGGVRRGARDRSPRALVAQLIVAPRIERVRARASAAPIDALAARRCAARRLRPAARRRASRWLGVADARRRRVTLRAHCAGRAADVDPRSPLSLRVTTTGMTRYPHARRIHSARSRSPPTRCTACRRCARSRTSRSAACGRSGRSSTAQVWIKKAAALTHKETGRLDAQARRRHRAGGGRSARRPASRPVRRRSVSGRRRHVAQHERERGARESRQRAARRRARRRTRPCIRTIT